MIAAGGALGAALRYGLSEAFPSDPAGFPSVTFGINVAGCLLIGVLMALVQGGAVAHPLVRPFLGVGVLGGFTTFSTYTVEIQLLVERDAAGTALAYLAATVAGAMAATWAGLVSTRWIIHRGRTSVGPLGDELGQP